MFGDEFYGEDINQHCSGERAAENREGHGFAPSVVCRYQNAGRTLRNAEKSGGLTLFEAGADNCTLQHIRRLSDIELCVLETDGSFSFFTSDDGEGEDGASDHEIT